MFCSSFQVSFVELSPLKHSFFFPSWRTDAACARRLMTWDLPAPLISSTFRHLPETQVVHFCYSFEQLGKLEMAKVVACVECTTWKWEDLLYMFRTEILVPVVHAPPATGWMSTTAATLATPLSIFCVQMMPSLRQKRQGWCKMNHNKSY